jgi:Cu(I)/Ag(I) efflux system membrane protein CusA/SilA
MALVCEASVEVGPALFFSLLVITLSFVPVFSLEAQEGKLFSPLAFTKTYAMAAAAGLSVTLIPVLMGYLVRGRIPHEAANPLNRFLMAVYRPALELVLRFPKGTLAVAAGCPGADRRAADAAGRRVHAAAGRGRPALHAVGTARPVGVKASELLQQTDRLIKTVPEVARVFGKAGRADTATDPAPLEMFETTIQFKPRERSGAPA